MKFQIDHDFHIHSYLSPCSGDPTQTKEKILKYAEKNGLKDICITDHLWADDAGPSGDMYASFNLNCAHVSQILPLPRSEKVNFHFGCEVDMDKHGNVGITKESAEKFDFIIIPTTHLHMVGFTLDPADTSTERRAIKYLEKLHTLMDKDLPFHKIGIAHLTCPLLNNASWEAHLATLDLISDNEFGDAFEKIAKKGAGFELNYTPSSYTSEDIERVLRPYKIAKEVGCKFYLGSDAHQEPGLDGFMARANDMVNLLALEEKDKFRF